MNSLKSLQYLILIFLSFFIYPSEEVRTCKSWLDYLDPLSTNCSESPDGAPANVTQILQRWGCTVEEYQLLTGDGYYILVIRAVLGSVTKSTPIVMGHGISMNSLAFVTMGNKTLAYYLLQLGYQIYLINFRGTRYSNTHITLTQDEPEYWDFSFHQMGQYDLRVTLDFVANQTNGQKAIYIGFSMGTTIGNVYCILYPEESASRLLGMIEMAPVANLTDIRSAVGYLSPSWPFLKEIAYAMWHGKLFPIDENRNEFCSSTLFGILFCYSMSALIFGPHYSMLDPATLPVTQEQNMDVISAKMCNHYYQIKESRRFQQYDNDYVQNMAVYGTPSPPLYNVSAIVVPTALIMGSNDYLAEVKNGRELYLNILPSSRCGFHIIADPEWPHNGFMISKDMFVYLFQVIIDRIETMESKSCSQIVATETI